MKARRGPVCVALALAALAGCRDQGPAARVSKVASASVLAHVQWAGFRYLEHAVVADSPTWAARWAQITRDGPQPPPVVDFARERVLLAAFGLHGSGGYDVTIDSVTDYYDSTVVHVSMIAPAPGCTPLAGPTSPVYAVRTLIPPEPVVFQDTQVLRCQ